MRRQSFERCQHYRNSLHGRLVAPSSTTPRCRPAASKSLVGKTVAVREGRIAIGSSFQASCISCGMSAMLRMRLQLQCAARPLCGSQATVRRGPMPPFQKHGSGMHAQLAGSRACRELRKSLVFEDMFWFSRKRDRRRPHQPFQIYARVTLEPLLAATACLDQLAAMR